MTVAGNGHPRDRLSEYLDDALEIEAREQVDRHLAGCEDCRAELAALRRLKQAVAEEAVPPVPPDLQARIGRRLDQATLARPAFRRFAIPTTIAATIGAALLLVALQWRQGRFGPPAVREPLRETTRASDELTRRNAPVPPPEERPSGQPASTLDQDLKRQAPPVFEEPVKTKKAEAEPSSVASGAEGSVHGGASAPAASGMADEATRHAAADDARRDLGAATLQNETSAPAPFAPSPATAREAPLAKAASAAQPSCLERWTDSGLRGSWDVTSIDAAERELGRVAHAVGGIGLWRGVPDGRPYIVVVPPDRLDEVVLALRARGVTELPEAAPLPEGPECEGIFVSLRQLPAKPE
jgi:hypothetical protein